MKFESNEKFSNDNQMLIAAKKILLDERFHARKVSLNSSKVQEQKHVGVLSFVTCRMIRRLLRLYTLMTVNFLAFFVGN